MDRSFVCEQIYQNPQGVFRLADVTTDQQALVEAYKESADLIYLDPPFYTNQRYAVKQRVGTAGYLGNRDYVLSVENDFDTFSSAEAYMDYLRTLLTTAHAILKKNGSIYIHVDFRAAYMVRGIADEIFGERNLLNEIVWHYKSGGRAKKFYSRKHDTIFFYKKRRQPYFDPDAVGMRRGEERRNNMKKGVAMPGRPGLLFHPVRGEGIPLLCRFRHLSRRRVVRYLPSPTEGSGANGVPHPEASGSFAADHPGFLSGKRFGGGSLRRQRHHRRGRRYGGPPVLCGG